MALEAARELIRKRSSHNRTAKSLAVFLTHLVPEPVAESADVGDADGAEVLCVVAEEDEEVCRLAVAELSLVGGEAPHVVDVAVGRPVLVQVRRRLAQHLIIILGKLRRFIQSIQASINSSTVGEVSSL